MLFGKDDNNKFVDSADLRKLSCNNGKLCLFVGNFIIFSKAHRLVLTFLIMLRDVGLSEFIF